MINIVFMGTPDFAVKPLLNIVNNKDKFNVIACVTNVDKPVGRKQILTSPPVKVTALNLGIPVYQFNKIRLEGVDLLKKLNPDLIITCAFGQILSQEILDIPKFGVYNIHASLLPKYRGASPIQYALLNGEKETGVTIMKTDIGLDTGDIISQEKIQIENNDNAGTLFEKLSILGANLIIKVLDDLINNKITFIKQDEKTASLSKIIKKEDGLLDFNQDNVKIVNKIRAFNPSPIAHTLLNGEILKIYSAEPSCIKGEVGKFLGNEKEFIIGTLNGSIKINFLQKAGGKVICAEDFLRGNKISPNTVFGKLC